jgi:hypothetical protein
VHSVLITQCLQRGFVDLVPKDRPLPNKLHVSPEEAERFTGVDPSQGQVAWQPRTLTTGHVELAPRRVTFCCHERRGGGDDHRDYRADHH